MGLRTALGLKAAKFRKRSPDPKFGVLSFGYENFFAFDEKLQRDGSYDINLGDNAQSIAARQLWRELLVDDEQIITVNRDTLSTYSGPPCLLIMNAVFFQQSFPVPPAIHPIFVGFRADADVISHNVAYFKRHEPIGCRDVATTACMMSHGIDAFTSGCITLALPPRIKEPTDGRLLVVYGSEFPSSVLPHIPTSLSEHCQIIYHRLPVAEFPVSRRTQLLAEAYERYLLDIYRETAAIVLTSLHHVAAPCMAMGIPVILCRLAKDDRFSFLEELTPVYTPDQFSSINWSPLPVDLSVVRENIRNLIAERRRLS